MFPPIAFTFLVTLFLMRMCFPFVHFRIPLSLLCQTLLLPHLCLINLWMLHMLLCCSLTMLQVLAVALVSSSLKNKHRRVRRTIACMGHAYRAAHRNPQELRPRLPRGHRPTPLRERRPLPPRGSCPSWPRRRLLLDQPRQARLGRLRLPMGRPPQARLLLRRLAAPAWAWATWPCRAPHRPPPRHPVAPARALATRGRLLRHLHHALRRHHNLLLLDIARAVRSVSFSLRSGPMGLLRGSPRACSCCCGSHC